MEFNKNLKELRKQNGLTQIQVAKSAGISLRTIQRYEQGECKPDFETAKKLAGILNVSLDYLTSEFNTLLFDTTDSIISQAHLLANQIKLLKINDDTFNKIISILMEAKKDSD